MNPARFKRKAFDPSAPAHRWKLYLVVHSRRGRFLHIFWPKVLGVLPAFILGGWIAATASVWTLVKYSQNVSEVRYVDLALPWRWPKYRSALASHYLRSGAIALKEGAASDALTDFTASAAMAPGNLECQRLIAVTQYRLGQPSAALATLKAGTGAAMVAGNEAFLREYFTAAFSLQANQEAAATGGRLLPRQPDSARTHLFVALQTATALYNQADYRDAARLLSAWGLQNRPEGEVLLARCEWGQGLHDQAMLRLERDLSRFGNRDELCFALESFARETSRPEAVLRYALLRTLGNPALPAARIDLLSANHALGRDGEESKEVDRYCADFGSNLPALGLLAEYAANIGRPAIAERVRDLTRAAGFSFSTADFDLEVAQAAIVARDYPRAVEAVAAAQAGKRIKDRGFDARVSGLRAVALAGAGSNDANRLFADFLPLVDALRPGDGLFLARELGRAGAPDKTRQLLQRMDAPLRAQVAAALARN